MPQKLGFVRDGSGTPEENLNAPGQFAQEKMRMADAKRPDLSGHPWRAGWERMPALAEISPQTGNSTGSFGGACKKMRCMVLPKSQYPGDS